MKAKQYANELVVAYSDAIMQSKSEIFTIKISEVFMSIGVTEVNELKKARNVSTDNGLIPIFKQQREKFGSICKIVNQVRPNLLSITDFDEVIKEIHPTIFEWYKLNVVNTI